MTDHFFNSKRNLNGNIRSSRRTFLKQSAVTGMAITSGLSITAQTLAKSPFSQLGLSQNKITPNPIRFNGERQDPITKQYHLGNGVRMYNPSLMRFHANDSMSPFGKGGINSYAYCLGDPVNRRDPSGHFAILSLLIGMIVGAIIGAIIAAAAEGVKVSITGGDFDWKQIAIGAALGAIGGGFGAAAQGASFSVKLGLAFADAIVSGVADFSLNVAAGTSAKDAAQNAAIGALIGLVTFGVGAGVGAGAKKFKTSWRGNQFSAYKSKYFGTPRWDKWQDAYSIIGNGRLRSHGAPGMMATPDGFLNGHELGDFMTKHSLLPSDPQRLVVLESCRSANGGGASLAQGVANRLGRRTLGFMGRADTRSFSAGITHPSAQLFHPQSGPRAAYSNFRNRQLASDTVRREMGLIL